MWVLIQRLFARWKVKSIQIEEDRTAEARWKEVRWWKVTVCARDDTVYSLCDQSVFDALQRIECRMEAALKAAKKRRKLEKIEVRIAEQ